jgi:uncharacterized protein HemX
MNSSLGTGAARTQEAVEVHSRAMTDVATTAAYSIVRDSVFGALLVVAVLGIAWLIRRLLSVQDQRVADQVRANELMERTREKTTALMSQMTSASSAVNVALEKLTDVQGDNGRAITELRSAVQALQSTMDSIIREAVREAARGRNDSYPQGSAQRPGAYSITDGGGREDGRRR